MVFNILDQHPTTQKEMDELKLPKGTLFSVGYSEKDIQDI